MITGTLAVPGPDAGQHRRRIVARIASGGSRPAALRSGIMTTVERCVPFSTVFNFRDLGGYHTVDSRTVRWGRMYRSDGLFRLAAGDLDSFARLGIRSVLDLRRPDELAADGRIAESLDLAYHHVNFHGSP